MPKTIPVKKTTSKATVAKKSTPAKTVKKPIVKKPVVIAKKTIVTKKSVPPTKGVKKPAVKVVKAMPKKTATAVKKSTQAVSAKKIIKKVVTKTPTGKIVAKKVDMSKPAAKKVTKPAVSSPVKKSINKPAAKAPIKKGTSTKADVKLAVPVKGLAPKEKKQPKETIDTELKLPASVEDLALGLEVPVKKTRGRKPKPKPEVDPNADIRTDRQKARDRKAKEKALLLEFNATKLGSEEQQELRRARLKHLIKMGKSRGYLTHGEINDVMSDELNDTDSLDTLIALLSDIGIMVYEQAPDAETLILNENAITASTDEEAEEEAEAALGAVDSEFGRTTDPVRMYMREMGTVDLLTREDEIVIAKKIEAGLKDM
jgi:RNA polymerase primary sigma factor